MVLHRAGLRKKPSKHAAALQQRNACPVFHVKCDLQYLGLFGALSIQGERESCLPSIQKNYREEHGRKVQQKRKSIAELEEPNRVHLYSHKSLTEAVGVLMLSVLKALIWRKCSELHCSFFKLRSI
ncbi:hypothetical protein SEVIR_8G249740v4 [Setaria viridis]